MNNREYIALEYGKVLKAEHDLRMICNSEDEYETTKEYCRRESITTTKSYLDSLNDMWHKLNM